MAEFTANFTLEQIEAIESTFVLNESTQIDAVFVIHPTPDKLSQLENDADYVQDADYVHTDNNLTDDLLADINNIPTATSDLTNDSGFITSADAPTTLAELSDDSTHRLVTDTQISDWDSKQDAGDYATNTDLTTGLGTKQDTLGYTPEDIANKNQSSGYCGLDSGGKVPITNLPTTLLQYQGVWDASTNTPTLISPDLTKVGYVYNVSVAGTQFSIDWSLGDWLIYNASGVVEKSDNSDDVTSVNGRVGSVSGLAELGSNNVFTGSQTFDVDTFYIDSESHKVSFGAVYSDFQVAIKRSSDSNSSSATPVLAVSNILGTQGNGLTTFNSARVVVQAGNGIVDTRLRSDYDASFMGGTLGTTSQHPFRFQTANVTRMSISDIGNIGFGVSTASSSKVEISSLSEPISGNGMFRYTSNTGTGDVGVKMGAFAGAATAGYAWIQGVHHGVGNDANICINPNAGNVTIGGITGLAKLEINAPQNTTSQFVAPFLRLAPTVATDTYGFTGVSYGISTVTNYGWTVGALRTEAGGTNHAFVFNSHVNSAGGTEIARFTTGGCFGINTKTPTNLLEIKKAGVVVGTVVQALVSGDSGSSEGVALAFGNVVGGTGANRLWSKIYGQSAAEGLGGGLRIATSEDDSGTMTDRLVVLPNGNIGLTNSNPTSKLQINTTLSDTGTQTARFSTLVGSTGTVVDALHLDCDPNTAYDKGVSLSFGRKNSTYGEYTSRIVHYGNSAMTTGSRLQMQTHSVTANTWNTGLFMDENGRVRIGTTDATYNQYLTVAGSAQIGTAFAYGTIANTIDLAIGSPSANSRILFGQSNTSYANFTWAYNTTLANCYLSIATNSNNNNILISPHGTGKVGINTVSPEYKLDVRGTASTDGIRSAIGFDIYQVPNPTTLTGVVESGGSLGTGAYTYYVTFTTNLGESFSKRLDVVTTAGNNTVTLTIPTSSDPRVVGRKLYRTKVNAIYYSEYYLANIANNTATTYTDTASDASLTGTSGLAFARMNSTSKMITVNGTTCMLLDNSLTSFGVGTGNTTMTSFANTLYGSGVGRNITTGGVTTAIGGSACRLLTSGNRNTVVGGNAAFEITTHSFNTIVGDYCMFYGTGDNNTYVGHYCGILSTIGVQTGCTFIGTNAGGNALQKINPTNIILLGKDSYGTIDNQVVIGNTSIVQTVLRGTVNMASTVAPTSASAAGVLGDVAMDENYIYICTATNTWKRTAINTW